MSLFKDIVLPKAFAKATEAKLRYSVGQVGEFDYKFKQQPSLLESMPSVSEMPAEQAEHNTPRVM